MDATILDDIRKELSRMADEKVKVSGEKFFREGVRLYGIRNAEVHRLSRERFRMLKDKSKETVFEYCEHLWKSGFIEESFVACNWSYAVRKQFEIDDIKVFERWIDRYVNNWASCDTFCNHTVGDIAEKYPRTLENLKEWAVSENRWMRRAASVSLIVPARKGKFLEDIISIASIVMNDRDDMVQKGYGWMLKAASESHQQEIFDFVIRHREVMPRTSFRYAIEKMPAEMRSAAMKK